MTSARTVKSIVFSPPKSGRDEILTEPLTQADERRAAAAGATLRPLDASA